MRVTVGELAAIVRQWAIDEPIITAAYIFGSRVKRTDMVDSDLDVAVELQTLPGDADPLAAWMFEGQRLTVDLQKLLPVKVQLEWYGGAQHTEKIHAYLDDAKWEVYPKMVPVLQIDTKS